MKGFYETTLGRSKMGTKIRNLLDTKISMAQLFTALVLVFSLGIQYQALLAGQETLRRDLSEAKAVMVTKAAFEAHQKINDERWEFVRQELSEIRKLLK